MNRSLSIPIATLLFVGLSPLTSFAETPKEAVTLTIEDRSFEIPLQQIETWQQIEIETLFTPNYKREWENSNVCALPLFFCDAFVDSRKQSTQQTTAASEIQTRQIKQYLNELKTQVDTPPTPSSIQKRSDSSLFTFTKGVDGLELELDKNLSILESITQNPLKFISSPVSLELAEAPSPLLGQAQELGIQEHIAQGISDFTGSSNDRIFNIKHALERFDAILIAPGETFSFTTALGPVEEYTGYRPELVIRKNVTEPEYGGGICQVSTTFFRAAVNAGLEIIDRRNHSYPVHYYTPIGFDATVYYPKPDLRIKNNFAHNILFTPSIDGKKLTFDVYGTSDDRQVDVTLPVITERKEDGSLKTQFTQTVKDKNGNILLEDVFKSAYDSPSKYPRPGEVEFTKKPKDWSKKQWEAYKKEKGL